MLLRLFETIFPPDKLDAFLDAVRWGAASTADVSEGGSSSPSPSTPDRCLA
jgi:hypothetical protein